MKRDQNKGSLSPAKRHLIELMQEINFGRIEDLEIRDGEPVLKPAPRIVRLIKLGAENGPRPQRHASDFTLKEPIREFLRHLQELQNGTIERIEIKHGLPFQMLVPQLR